MGKLAYDTHGLLTGYAIRLWFHRGP